jgi:hypothetical protein
MTVWLLLVTATIVSWALGTEHLLGPRGASVAVLVVAFVKARVVGLHFMELRSAPVRLRVAFEGWVVVVCSVLIGLYVSGV